MPPRGPYAKSAATREQVLTAALEIIAERGLSSTTIQQIADAVGMTKQGLLHHFGSREELLLSVIARSDELNTRDLPAQTALEALIEVDQHNMEVPGLVALFLGLAGAAASERGDTRLRRAFADRYHGVRTVLASNIQNAQAAGTLRDDLDPHVVAALVIAASDGLQMQALIVDRTPVVLALRTLQALLAPPQGTEPTTRTSI
jgi:TetR/AcrR family transcriptional regulator, transcriptional repressor of aconitase